MFLIKDYQTIFCPNGCKIFSDGNNYEYWENKETTSDELEITNFLKSHISQNIKLLHIGVGNSYLAKSLNNQVIIDGISISSNEINYAKKLNLSNYNVYFSNKLGKDSLKFLKENYYDFIIDVNLKSFSCCDIAFDEMFRKYSNLLNKNGKILTAKDGLNWTRLLKPVYRFSFKKFFYRRLKEFDGPERNKLSMDDCLNLASNNNLNLEEIINSNIISFKKQI